MWEWLFFWRGGYYKLNNDFAWRWKTKTHWNKKLVAMHLILWVLWDGAPSLAIWQEPWETCLACQNLQSICQVEQQYKFFLKQRCFKHSKKCSKLINHFTPLLRSNGGISTSLLSGETNLLLVIHWQLNDCESKHYPCLFYHLFCACTLDQLVFWSRCKHITPCKWSCVFKNKLLLHWHYIFLFSFSKATKSFIIS